MKHKGPSVKISAFLLTIILISSCLHLTEGKETDSQSQEEEEVHNLMIFLRKIGTLTA